MGLGFSAALTCIGAVRELLGAGEIFGIHVMPESYVPVSIFIMAPGAFFVLALLTAIQNKVKIGGEKKGKDMSKIQSGCGSDCMNCSDSGCTHRLYDEKADRKKPAVNKETVPGVDQNSQGKNDIIKTDKANSEQTKEEKKNG